MKLSQQLLLSSTFAGLSAAVILKDSSQLKESYHFIIVGGLYLPPAFSIRSHCVSAGPGGATTANRLTESANVNVLLLEAGGA